MKPSGLTPLTVIGGFLGAGKTTFLNHLLRAADARYAVLVNDFGEINIDASLVARHDGATMTLSNGCVCCSIGGSFVETLSGLLDREMRFDHIVIEASGVGSPWRIAEIAMVEPTLVLNGVVVVADVSRIEGLLADARVGDTVREQFQQASLVLLSKTDLVDSEKLASARDAILALRPQAKIVETAAHVMRELQVVSRLPGSAFRADEITETGDHETAFRRWSYRRSGAFDLEGLSSAIADLPSELLRLKGPCRVRGNNRVALLQMVQRCWTLTYEQVDFDEIHDDIALVGIGTTALPPTAALDSILDRALAQATAP